MKPTLLLHLIRKDIRALRVPLVLMWLAMVCMACVPFTAKGAMASRYLLIGTVVLLALVEILSLQLDPPKSTSRFLKTRPVSVATLLTGKWLLLVLVGLLPILLVGFIQTLRADMGLTLRDYAWLWSQALLVFIAVTGILAPVVVYTRSILHFIKCTIYGLILLTCLVLIFASEPESFFVNLQKAVNEFFFNAGKADVNLTRMYLFYALLGCTGYVMAISRYLQWRCGWKILAPIAGLGITVLCVRSTSWSLLPSMEASAEQRAKAEEALKNATVEYHPRKYKGWSWEPFITSLRVQFDIHGLPPSYYFEQKGWSSSARLADGKVFDSPNNFSSEKRWDWLPIDTVANRLEIKLVRWQNVLNGEYNVGFGNKWMTPEVFDARQPDFKSQRPASDFQDSVVTGYLDVYVREAVMRAKLPLVKGAEYVHRGVRVRIADVNKEGDAPTFDVESSSYSWHPPVTGYHADRSKNLLEHHFTAGGWDAGHTLIYPACFRHGRYQASFYFRDEKGLQIKDAPIGESRIYLFEAQDVATHQFPFELRDIPMLNSGFPVETSETSTGDNTP